MLTQRFLVAVAATFATAAAQYKGFNYASTNADGSDAVQADFENLFTNAQNLVGGDGFSSARLYTMIQSGTTNSPIEAIPAAIKTKTSLLLGLWASGGDEMFNNELAALSSALEQYGTQFTSLIAGISVGSEDMYRITPTGIANKAGIGAGPDVIVNYIKQTRAVLSKASMNSIKVGHVDTWSAWVNGSNAAAVQASDFLGLDSYPYFETVSANAIDHGLHLFDKAFGLTTKVAAGREVWITETGWPISGPKSGAATAGAANAKVYWDQVACKYLGKVNMWYYTLFDGTPSPSFGLTGSTLSNQPVFDLKCPKKAAVSHSKKPSHKTSHKSAHATSTHSHSKTATAHKSHSTTMHSASKKHHHHHHTASSAKQHKVTHNTEGANAAAPTSPAAQSSKPAGGSSGAGALQPSGLLIISMLLLWCL